MKKCPKCGIEAESKFCPECGTELVEIKNVNTCPKCGTESESKFCPECGTAMDCVGAEMEVDASETKAPESVEVTKATNESENKNKKKVVFIAVGAIVLLLIIVGIVGGSSSSDTSTTDSGDDYEYEEETEAEETSVYASPSDFKKEACIEVAYDDLERTPDDYLGKYIKVTGSVIQVVDGDTVALRVDVSGDYDDIIYVEYDPSIMDVRVLEDDDVTLYGRSAGIYTYESSGAGSISIPSMIAYSIEIN